MRRLALTVILFPLLAVPAAASDIATGLRGPETYILKLDCQVYDDGATSCRVARVCVPVEKRGRGQRWECHRRFPAVGATRAHRGYQSAEPE